MSVDSDIIRNDSSEAQHKTEPLAGEAAHDTDPLADVFAATAVLSREEIPEVTDVAAVPQVQTGSLLRERFLLQEEIDAGGMGVVYKALDRQLADADGNSPTVAIKVLSPKLARNTKALRALQQEATKIRCLTHPHIVRFIDFDRDGDQYFLVMEWLEGKTLANILDSADARNIDRIYAMKIVRQISEALEYAHRCGIVHADVKPGNVMILPNGDAKLFDFGVARVRQAHSVARFDSDAMKAATPAYASMQVLTGEAPAATDDVFSLACLLYRLIAGYRVFGPRNAADASQEGMTPQRPQGFSDEQWSAMRKALSYSRVTRFASMEAFINALEEEVDPIPEAASYQANQLEGPSRRSHLPIAVGVLMLVSTAGVAVSGQGQSWLKSLLATGEPESVVAVSGEPIAAVPVPTTAIAEPANESNADAELVSVGAEEMSQPAAAKAEVLSVDEDLPANEVLAVDEVLLEYEALLEYEVPVDDDVGVDDEVLLADQVLVAAAVPVEPEPSLAADIPAKTVAVIAPKPIDSIGFSADEVRVRESESAAQIDIVRTGSIELPLTIEYTISGITAAQGIDFFAPDSNVISFAVGQETARLLIPLVQDFAAEGDEHFLLRLGGTAGIPGVAGRHSAVVTISDD